MERMCNKMHLKNSQKRSIIQTEHQFDIIRADVISIEYSAVGDTDSVSYGKPTSLADGSTAMATYLHENFIPLFLEEMDHFYLFMEVNSLQEIRLFCKNCKKSLHMSYILTNDGDTPVLPNVAIKCTCCKRVLMLKKYTEKKLLEHAVSDRFYI